MGKITTIAGAAKRLVDDNEALRTIVEQNPRSSYKALQERITGRVTARVAAKYELGYTKPRDLIWAIVDYVQDGDEDDIKI